MNIGLIGNGGMFVFNGRPQSNRSVMGSVKFPKRAADDKRFIQPRIENNGAVAVSSSEEILDNNAFCLDAPIVNIWRLAHPNVDIAHSRPSAALLIGIKKCVALRISP